MNRFSHIVWYEWVLYVIFSIFCLLLVYAALVNLDREFSPLMPQYATFLIISLHLGNLVCTVPSLVGVYFLLMKKKAGWILLFYGSTTFVLLPFIPIHGLPFNYIPRPDFSALFFLLIPLVLFLKRSEEYYQIKNSDLRLVSVLIFFILFLRFISFHLFSIF